VHIFSHFAKVGWIKVNIDVVATGVPSFASCGGMCSFFVFLDIQHVSMLKSWISFWPLKMLIKGF